MATPGRFQPVSFEYPPVNEVAYSVQFAMPVIDLEVLGGIAARVKSEFPERQQHAPLPPAVEQFGRVPQGPQIVFRTEPDLPRTWFVTADGTRILQAQADRFVFNWRRTAPGQSYPRYERLRDEFRPHLAALMESLAPLHPSGAEPNVVEMIYVNELVTPDEKVSDHHPPLGRFVRALGPLNGSFLPEPEDARLQARWRINNHEGTPIGRLYASVEPAVRGDEVPVYLLNMTARLLASGADADRVVALMDCAHDWIVRGFKDLTPDEMHEFWRLKEERE